MAMYRKGAKVRVTIDGLTHDGEIENVIELPKGAGSVHNPYLRNGGRQEYRVFLPNANGGVGQLRTVTDIELSPPLELSQRTFNEGDRVRYQGKEHTIVSLDKEREDGTKMYVLQADGFENAHPRDFPWERGISLASAGALEPIMDLPDAVPADIMDLPKPELRSKDAAPDPGPWRNLDDDLGHSR